MSIKHLSAMAVFISLAGAFVPAPAPHTTSCSALEGVVKERDLAIAGIGLDEVKSAADVLQCEGIHDIPNYNTLIGESFRGADMNKDGSLGMEDVLHYADNLPTFLVDRLAKCVADRIDSCTGEKPASFSSRRKLADPNQPSALVLVTAYVPSNEDAWTRYPGTSANGGYATDEPSVWDPATGSYTGAEGRLGDGATHMDCDTGVVGNPLGPLRYGGSCDNYVTAEFDLPTAKEECIYLSQLSPPRSSTQEGAAPACYAVTCTTYDEVICHQGDYTWDTIPYCSNSCAKGTEDTGQVYCACCVTDTSKSTDTCADYIGHTTSTYSTVYAGRVDAGFSINGHAVCGRKAEMCTLRAGPKLLESKTKDTYVQDYKAPECKDVPGCVE